MADPDRRSPTPAELSDLLHSIQQSFEWASRADDYQLVATWFRERSGSQFFRLLGVPAGPEIVIKTASGWGVGDARTVFEAMSDLADAIDHAGIPGAHAIRPLAWSDTPPTVVAPYVEGSDLVTVLRTPHQPAWQENVSSAMSKAGSMLAAFHSHHPAPGQLAAANQEASELARRFRISLVDVDWRQQCIEAFGDFGPGNFHLTPEGDLYLLDPPITPAPALIHRDLGNFVFELRRQLAGRGHTPHPPVPGHFDQLCDAFLGGYASASNDGDLGPGDRALIALYEARRAVGMARKRFPARSGDALWFAKTAFSLRRRARSR